MLRSTIRLPIAGRRATVVSTRQLLGHLSRCHYSITSPTSSDKRELKYLPHPPIPDKSAISEIRWVTNDDKRKPGFIKVKTLARLGQYVEHSLPSLWLRDNCKCPECVHPVTKQRQLDTFAIPRNLFVMNAEIDESNGKVDVYFSDGHHTTYTIDQLNANVSYDHGYAARNGNDTPILWGKEIRDHPPVVDYKKVMASDDGVKEWIYWIKRYGFCYVEGCPVTPEATQELLERIAFVRPTHYGGFWDFTADMASNDTAYTNLALDAHTDNTYFTDPARLQMFHLLSHEGGEGGESLLVDGFKVAMDLQREHEWSYMVLARNESYGHASGNEGISIFPQTPAPTFNHRGSHLYQIRWNNYDRDTLIPPIVNWERWYKAARMWDGLLRSRANQYWEQLKPGRPLIFDNWRILHGRSAFTGQRRLCGGYINSDDFMARYRALHFPNKGIMHWQMPGR